jgi:hypothetical protein
MELFNIEVIETDEDTRGCMCGLHSGSGSDSGGTEK